jgi:hypothetical protein
MQETHTSNSRWISLPVDPHPFTSESQFLVPHEERFHYGVRFSNLEANFSGHEAGRPPLGAPGRTTC